jgi:AMMECR1 domain-containing protein
MRLLHATDVLARWRGRIPRTTPKGALGAIVTWIRTVSLEGDLFVLETGDSKEVLSFPFPSMPEAAPERAVVAEDSPRIRFIVRAGPRTASRPAKSWRTILSVREVEVLERDAPHGPYRPLRLGLSDAEGLAALQHVRRSAAHFVAEAQGEAPVADTRENPRLALRSGVAVAVWTRGRLRGSIVCAPGSALRTLGQAAVWACQDSRFERLAPSDLDDTMFQATILHAPRVTLAPEEIATQNAYPDKALTASLGLRSGIYLPEIFNLAGHRTLRSLTASVAKEKAGIVEANEETTFEVCEVTEIVESNDRSRAVRLDGPVARCAGNELSPASARESGEAATDWLARIQREDGSLPLRIRTVLGTSDGVDLPRMAMTAEGLAAFGVAHDFMPAVAAARRVLGWLERSEEARKTGAHGLLVVIYMAKAKLWLDGRKAADDTSRMMAERLARIDGDLPVLVASHALTLIGLVARAGGGNGSLSRYEDALVRDLAARFTRATSDAAAASLAEWAELGMAPDVDIARRVKDWLVSQQLSSGAFPDTTTSDFVYTRGTGKIFEVLAESHAPLHQAATTSALHWLVRMQYRPDSVFFVPSEHRSQILGGVRHDYTDRDAWIDSAGHLLLGLARRTRS